jgi:hypothetical protein
MLQLVIDHTPAAVPPAVADLYEFGEWTNHRVPQDRSGWHSLVNRFFDHWLAVSPPDRLPGRQHIVPEDIALLWSRLWMLDVFREPLRFRYRLCGTDIVRSFGRELTGKWLDEAHPQTISDPVLRQRFRFMTETGLPTWRRGPPLLSRDPEHVAIETCLVPLAADGRCVDKLLGISVAFGRSGRPV